MGARQGHWGARQGHRGARQGHWAGDLRLKSSACPVVPFRSRRGLMVGLHFGLCLGPGRRQGLGSDLLLRYEDSELSVEIEHLILDGSEALNHLLLNT